MGEVLLKPYEGIRPYAFISYAHDDIEKIVIPYSVETIDDTAFRGCSNLKEVYIESETIQDLGWEIFYGYNENLVVYYCSEIVKKYCENQIFKSLPFTPKILEE